MKIKNVQTKTMIENSMIDFLCAYYRGEVKHKERYRVFGYWIPCKKLDCIWLNRDSIPFSSPFIPTHIKYERYIDIEKWKRFRKYKNLTCEKCEYGEDFSTLKLCKADCERISLCGLERPKWCPLVN